MCMFLVCMPPLSLQLEISRVGSSLCVPCVGAMKKRPSGYTVLGGGYLQREREQKQKLQRGKAQMKQSGVAQYLVLLALKF